MTDKEKQIEEMAKDVTGSIVWCSLEDDFLTVDGSRTAEVLYEIGYRKQVEGEWKDSDRNGVSVKGYMVCTACDVMIPTCDDGIYCLSRLHYCPRCGAKMSGGKTLEINSERRYLTFGSGEPAISHEKAVEIVKEYARLYEAGYRKQFDGDFIEVVRCKDCDVPHNKWTGCPNLNGMIPPPEFFCARGERKQKEMKGGAE